MFSDARTNNMLSDTTTGASALAARPIHCWVLVRSPVIIDYIIIFITLFFSNYHLLSLVDY